MFMLMKAHPLEQKKKFSYQTTTTKKLFINLLGIHLSHAGHTVKHATRDADVLIVSSGWRGKLCKGCGSCEGGRRAGGGHQVYQQHQTLREVTLMRASAHG